MGVLPTKKQLDFLDWEIGAFFHFGIRTFYEGHRDWDMQQMPLSGFNPKELDCDSWIKTVRDAGLTYAILVCKHHDGFANWPSAYTDYSVANTPWKDGKGDVVREFTDACRKYGIKTGLYYSPAQFGSSKMDAEEYDDYFISQISELLGNYGTVDYLWFDGCGSEGHTYDTKRIIGAIRSLQPEILVFNMWDPDTRWVGNESGVAPSPNENRVSALDFSVQTTQKDQLDEKKFLPAECDFRMRERNWFYSDLDSDTVKSVEELMGLYDYSVGRGANFLVNIGPDRRGLLPEPDASRLLEFGEALKQRFSNPLCGELVRDGKDCTLTLKEPALVGMVVLREELLKETAIGHYEIFAYPHEYGAPIKVFTGDTVGHKAICTFPPIRTKKLCIVTDGGEITDGKAYAKGLRGRTVRRFLS